VRILNDNPQIRRVAIEGHTDSAGDAVKNRALSQERAEAVATYLTQKGIAAERLTAKGHGPDNPIASNRTAEGRAKNRRVELHVE
jgi:outer membrane protein OmpA-like peptidoglycan-associated protein